MFEEIIDYLRQEKPGFEFKDWQCITALVLPNSSKTKQLKNHKVFSKHDLKTFKFPESIPELQQTHSDMEEYTILASTMLACVHSASIVNAKGIPELRQIPSDVHETHREQAGRDANPDNPGFNVDKLAGDLFRLKTSKYDYLGNRKAKKSARVKEPANSYPSWLFWNPDQANIIFSDKNRLIIHGAYGSGKTQVSEALMENCSSALINPNLFSGAAKKIVFLVVRPLRKKELF